MIRRSAVAMLVALSCGVPGIHAEKALAPVEARVPFAPEGFTGTDGAVHLAYELHITNFYGDTGALKPKGLQVFGDDAKTPLLVLDKNQLSQFVRPSPAEHTPVSLAPGKRAADHRVRNRLAVHFRIGSMDQRIAARPRARLLCGLAAECSL